MVKITWFRTAGLVGLVMIGVAGAVSGQAQIPGATTLDQLLTEVQGLRSEFTHATGASIRAQLLVARLQLQEQRIANLGRQLTELQAELTTVEQEQSMTFAKAKALQSSRDRLSVEQQEAVEQEVEQMTLTLEHGEKRAQDLRALQTEIEGLLTDEQARWTDFNGRLDELELSLPR